MTAENLDDLGCAHAFLGSTSKAWSKKEVTDTLDSRDEHFCSVKRMYQELLNTATGSEQRGLKCGQRAEQMPQPEMMQMTDERYWSHTPLRSCQLKQWWYPTEYLAWPRSKMKKTAGEDMKPWELSWPRAGGGRWSTKCFSHFGSQFHDFFFFCKHKYSLIMHPESTALAIHPNELENKSAQKLE